MLRTGMNTLRCGGIDQWSNGANSKAEHKCVLMDNVLTDNLTTDADVHTDTSTIKQLGKLKIIFWNSNGWEQERCDKIAEVALEEESDVIFIQDARMHPAREGHMKGYEKRLERATG